MMNETVVTIDRTIAPAPQQHQQQHQQPAGGVGPARSTAPTPAPAPGVQPSGGGALSWIQFNYQYFLYTIPGYLKIAQLVLGILCMALASPAHLGSTHWFLFVVVTSFIASLLWMFVYLLGIREVLNLAVNWILTEFLNSAIATLLYFIAFVVQLAAWSPYPTVVLPRGANIAAGVFGLFNTLVYAASTYLLYVEHRTTLPR